MGNEGITKTQANVGLFLLGVISVLLCLCAYKLSSIDDRTIDVIAVGTEINARVRNIEDK